MKIFALTRTFRAEEGYAPSLIVVIARDEIRARNCAYARFGRQVLWPSQYAVEQIGTADERFDEACIIE